MICSFDGCEKPVLCRGMCNVHYQRLRRKGLIRSCSIEGCTGGAEAHGLCCKHLRRKDRHGDPLKTLDRTHCDIPGCPDRHWGHGLCRRHYEMRRRFQAEAEVCIVEGCTRKASPDRCRDMCCKCFRERKHEWEATRPLRSDELRRLLERHALQRSVSVDTIRREVGLSGDKWKSETWSEKTIDRILTEHFGFHPSYVYGLDVAS